MGTPGPRARVHLRSGEPLSTTGWESQAGVSVTFLTDKGQVRGRCEDEVK